MEYEISPSQKQAQLQDQLDQGFNRLNFHASLEPDFQQHLAHLIRRRIAYIGSFSFILLSLYACLDFLFLPDYIWQYTLQVRLTMLIPVMVLAGLLIKDIRHPKLLTYATFFSYVWMGIGVIILIAGAQFEGYDLPYEGLYSVILFGFFLLGLPFKLILMSTWGLWLFYGIVEVVIGHTDQLLPQLFFLASMCSIGTLGSYLHEHTLRTGYLKHQLLKLSRQQAVADREAKTQFLAAAGHDLRQPINAINLISEALQKTSATPQQDMMTERLGYSVDMLNRLLDSLLEYSRLEMGQVSPYYEHIKVDVLLHETLQAMIPQLEKAGIQLEENIQSANIINSDLLLLERILKNLINNVIQHSKASQLSVVCKESNQHMIIDIKDNGCGISEQHIDAIFDQYYQVTPNRELGMGLGLSIVKQLTKLLNIDLTVRSQTEQGTCFTLTLPLSNPGKGSDI